ncbi:MAG: acetoacetate decarboxylase family protein [Spirochaetia bacterium]|nr:acetoacetate decarboxylase family protein [Spirochaetia bacterium]
MNKNKDLLSIEYKNTIAATLFFFIDYKNAIKIVDERLVPVKYFYKKSLAFISFYDNKNSSIGSYFEIAAGIKAKTIGADKKGYYICNLPVSTKKACDMGKKHWGFPKTLNNIEMKLEKKSIEVFLKNLNLKPIILFKLASSFFKKVKSKDLTLLSIKNGDILASMLQVEGESFIGRCNNYQQRIFEVRHKIIETINLLNMEKKKPLFIIYSKNKRCVLSAPKKI